MLYETATNRTKDGAIMKTAGKHLQSKLKFSECILNCLIRHVSKSASRVRSRPQVSTFAMGTALSLCAPKLVAVWPCTCRASPTPAGHIIAHGTSMSADRGKHEYCDGTGVDVEVPVGS
jgi:hypothetical protein